MVIPIFLTSLYGTPFALHVLANKYLLIMLAEVLDIELEFFFFFFYFFFHVLSFSFLSTLENNFLLLIPFFLISFCFLGVTLDVSLSMTVVYALVKDGSLPFISPSLL